MKNNYIIHIPTAFIGPEDLKVGIQLTVAEITQNTTDIIRINFRGRLFDLMQSELREAVVEGRTPHDQGNGRYQGLSPAGRDPVYETIMQGLGGIQSLNVSPLAEAQAYFYSLSSRAQKIDPLVGSVTMASTQVDSYRHTYPNNTAYGFDSYGQKPECHFIPGDTEKILDKNLIKSNIIGAEKISRKLEPSAKITIYGFTDVCEAEMGKFEDKFGILAEQLPELLERKCEVIPSIPPSHNNGKYEPPGLIIRP